MSSFWALHEVTGAHRLFCSLYTDRGSRIMKPSVIA